MSGRHLRAARRLLGLLDEERRALLRADFGRLERLSRQLQAACDSFESLPLSDDPHVAAEIEHIRRDAARNQTLAEACRRGVAAGTRLRQEHEAARTRLSTYTGTGLRRDLSTAAMTRDRRA